MKVNWTEEQTQVMDLRDCNILVSAAAGSGKTAVLVERIMRRLTDPDKPADIDRLVIVTFTNAAAGEMKDRIRRAIEERLEEEEDPVMTEHLVRQSALLQNARISTIHSFCQFVIRNYFHRIDLDPDFRIADEGEIRLLKKDVAEELLEEKYEQGRPEFLQMTEMISAGSDDRELEKMILELYGFSVSFPWPEEFLDRCRQDYRVDSLEEYLGLPWMKDMTETIRIRLSDCLSLAEAVRERLDEPDMPETYIETVEADIEALQSVTGLEDYRQLYSCLSAWKWARISGKRTGAPPENKELIKSLREAYKETVSKICEDFFYDTPEDLFEQHRKCQPFMDELLTLAGEFSARFSRKKREKNLCDFNDLEHMALEILVQRKDGKAIPTQTARELSLQFDEIMIDEYQDSNLVQEMIMNAVSGMEEGRYNVFMVGDVKQSIYRFRMARPELFMEKFHTYSRESGCCRRIDLHSNFRSRSQVLDGANEIFSCVMREDLGKVEYDEDARLNCGASFEPGVPEEDLTAELMLLDLSEIPDDVEDSRRELEARMIGMKIRSMAGSHPVWDDKEKKYRPAGYGDFVILLRTMKDWSESFSRVLTDMGIPNYAGSNTGYFSAPEVQVVLSLLKIIDNPRQDIPLAAVLNSPVAGCTPTDLAAVRSRHPDMGFWEACMEDESLRDFFEMLEHFRKMASYLSVHELLRVILETTGYAAFAASMPGGEQRKANLDMLVEKAAVFESGIYHGLYHFVRYIENLHKYEVDFGEAAAGSREENMVRIMSIHKSKGLEFKIVFVSGLDKKMNDSDRKGSLLMHTDIGIGCSYTDLQHRYKTDTLFKNYIRMRLKNDDYGEELRVLYVALTRAKEKLIMTASVRGLDQRENKWNASIRGKGEPLSYSDRLGARSSLDWIMPVILQAQDETLFRIRHFTADDLTDEEKEYRLGNMLRREQFLEMTETAVPDDGIRTALENELGYVYPYTNVNRIPSKVSVSELKLNHMRDEEMEKAQDEESRGMYQEVTPVPLLPAYLQEEKELSGAARGTIYHKVMECMDFTKAPGEELARITAAGLITGEDALAVDVKRLEAFRRDPLAERMRRAQESGQLFREQQFVLQADAAGIDPRWDSPEKVLIQGIIDAYFVEDGEIVLLDYKTDRVKSTEASSLYEKYRVQLDYYKMALERLTPYKVKEQIIWSFCLDRVITGRE